MNWEDPLIPTLFQSSDTIGNTGLEFSSFDCAFPTVNFYDKFAFYVTLPFALIIMSFIVHIAIWMFNKNSSLKNSFKVNILDFLRG